MENMVKGTYNVTRCLVFGKTDVRQYFFDTESIRIVPKEKEIIHIKKATAYPQSSWLLF